MVHNIKNKIKSIGYVGSVCIFIYGLTRNPVRILYFFINFLFLIVSVLSFNFNLVRYFYSYLKRHGIRCPHHICRYLSWNRSRLKFKENCDSFKGKKIAIIGNAKSLLDKEYGELIDSHDIVIRINRANVVNSKSQGNRTSIWATSFNYENTLEDYKLVIWLTPFFHSDLCYPSKFMLNNCFLIYPFRDWISLTEKVKSYPTSGVMLLDFVMKYTDYNKVSLFGFDFFKTPNHYENKVYVKHKFHDFDGEEIYVKDIVKNKKNRVELYV